MSLTGVVDVTYGPGAAPYVGDMDVMYEGGYPQVGYGGVGDMGDTYDAERTESNRITGAVGFGLYPGVNVSG